MTPLAHALVKEMTLQLKRRTFIDRWGLLPEMSDIHCFELSEVSGLVENIANGISRNLQSTERLSFLPAPKTWMEWKKGNIRYGILLKETELGANYVLAESSPFCSKRGGFIALRRPFIVKYPGDALLIHDPGLSPVMASALALNILGALAVINTPRVVGRRQHMSHRGLERDLVRAKKTVGNFPLHAWTEIKLEVCDPRDASRDPSTEAHYTGMRALHFCRAHLRVRLGKLEIVRSHWRGDGSLGIKQSRYRLTAPNSGGMN